MFVLVTYDVATVEKAVLRTEHHGTDKPVDLTEPLVL